MPLGLSCGTRRMYDIPSVTPACFLTFSLYSGSVSRDCSTRSRTSSRELVEIALSAMMLTSSNSRSARWFRSYLSRDIDVRSSSISVCSRLCLRIFMKDHGCSGVSDRISSSRSLIVRSCSARRSDKSLMVSIRDRISSASAILDGNTFLFVPSGSRAGMPISEKDRKGLAPFPVLLLWMPSGRTSHAQS